MSFIKDIFVIFYFAWCVLIDQINGRDTGGEFDEPEQCKAPRDAGLLYAGLVGACLVILVWVATGVIV